MAGSKRLILIAAGLYLLSFLLPACTLDSPLSSSAHSTVLGAGAFLLALLTPSPGWLAWMANPLLWLALILLHNGRVLQARVMGTVAATCATVGVGIWIAADSRLLSIDIGYFLWCASFVTIALGSLLLQQHKRTTN